MKIFNATYLTLIMGLVLLMSACKKNDNEQGDLEPMRYFKPGAVSVAAGQTQAKLTWAPSLFSSGAKLQYTIEVSKDTTFATKDFSLTSDTAGVTITDDKLVARQKYFVRVKTNAQGDKPESKWMNSSGFSITGEQYFNTLKENDIKETSVTLKWRTLAGLTKITLTPQGGTAADVTLTAADLAANAKTITGLTAGTAYIAELFMGAKSKGYLTFATKVATVYSTILAPGSDIAAAVTAAANGAVIGLQPGTYNAGTVNYTVLQKNITLKSTSDNPLDTKVNFKEFTLRSNGAGIRLVGIEFDGTASGALYFINLTGVSVDAEKASFANISIENCIVHAAATSFIRGNRGTAAKDYTIDAITVKNSTVYDIGSLQTFNCFHLDKLQFNTLSVTNSTFYNFGKTLISCGTLIDAVSPTITFDHCTFNAFGGSGTYALLDANTNIVKFTMQNSIIANTPKVGTANGAAIRSSAATTTIVFNNNNTFNLQNGSGAALTLPAGTGNKNVNLGWDLNTKVFTIPTASELNSSSNTSGPIGDPQWVQ